MIDDANDDKLGPAICRNCWNGWHDSCDGYCDCDADEHNEPFYNWNPGTEKE